MVDYIKDEALGQIHEEMYRLEKEREKERQGVTELNPNSKFILGLIMLGIVVLVWSEKISFQMGAMIGAAVAIVAYLSMMDRNQVHELSNIECMIRLYDQLKFLQTHPIGDLPQVPEGEIQVQLIGKRQIIDSKPVKRMYGVRMYDAKKDIMETYLAEVDLFTGDIIKFKDAPEGVYGDEASDLKYIPSPDMKSWRRREEYMRPMKYS